MKKPIEVDSEELRVVVWGKFACYTRPEMKVERMSYEVMTPSVARNILQAIYWHPGLDYRITAIDVLKPIQMIQMKRNELKSKIIASNVLTAAKTGGYFYSNSEKDTMQRSSLILKDVQYVIHTIMTRTEDAEPEETLRKFKKIFTERAHQGKCFTQPYFGCKEFPANFRLMERKEIMPAIRVTKDLGIMLYDKDYTNPENIRPLFFHAYMKNGTIKVENPRIWR